MPIEHYELIVIGEGVAGLSAATAAARAGINTATFETVLFGGLITNINSLDPAPALYVGPAIASGADLGAEMFQACADLGVARVGQSVVRLEVTRHALSGDGISVHTEDGEYRADRIIIATGARLKALGVPGEAEFAGRGVSQCADCDGPMYRKDEVIVVGGGDSALQEALALAEHCVRVHLVHRRDHFRARADLAARVSAQHKIQIHWDSEVVAIEGTNAVERVLLRHSGQTSALPCAGIFAYPGLVPNTDFLPADIARDAHGRIQTDVQHETSQPDIFAAGVVRTGCGGSADDAILDGRDAADSVIARRRSATA